MVVAITRIASDLVASAVNTRNWLLLVLKVPQVVFTFCTLPGVKLLRVALWLAKPAAVLVPVQLPPRLTASSTAISATRCNLRCSVQAPAVDHQQHKQQHHARGHGSHQADRTTLLPGTIKTHTA